MNIIIAIVGPSGSGKTYMAQYMNDTYGIPSIASYTTRPIREGEVDGREHTFATMQDIPDEDKRLAFTMFGGHAYWATTEQAEKYGICSYVIDEIGLVTLREKHSRQFEIIPVRVKRNGDAIELSVADKDRVKRDEDRIKLEDSYYDFVIDNNGTLGEFEAKIDAIVKMIR